MQIVLCSSQSQFLLPLNLFSRLMASLSLCAVFLLFFIVHFSSLSTSLFTVHFPCGSSGKESSCNAGDLGSIPSWERPLEKGKVTHSSILAWRIPWSPWGHLSDFHFHFHCSKCGTEPHFVVNPYLLIYLSPTFPFVISTYSYLSQTSLISSLTLKSRSYPSTAHSCHRH